ncbi:hypothetical protein LIZ87_06585 [Lacrimispora sp. 210928-DFI.3.58]|nr:hypothetical protein [Lacrimispora sp. 210928-DFI.3.58]
MINVETVFTLQIRAGQRFRVWLRQQIRIFINCIETFDMDVCGQICDAMELILDKFSEISKERK